MKLSIMERLILLSVLPKEANVVELRISRTLREALEFSEKELEDLKMRAVSEGDKVSYQWDRSQDGYEVDIAIGERAHDIVVQTLKNLNRQKKLTDNHLSLWDKFCPSAE